MSIQSRIPLAVEGSLKVPFELEPRYSVRRLAVWLLGGVELLTFHTFGSHHFGALAHKLYLRWFPKENAWIDSLIRAAYRSQSLR